MLSLPSLSEIFAFEDLKKMLQLLQEVRVLADQMSQPTSSVNAEVSRVFGRSQVHESKLEPKSDCNCKFFAFQASHEHEMNWHLQYKGQDKSVKIQGERNYSILV